MLSNSLEGHGSFQSYVHSSKFFIAFVLHSSTVLGTWDTSGEKNIQKFCLWGSLILLCQATNSKPYERQYMVWQKVQTLINARKRDSRIAKGSGECQGRIWAFDTGWLGKVWKEGKIWVKDLKEVQLVIWGKNISGNRFHEILDNKFLKMFYYSKERKLCFPNHSGLFYSHLSTFSMLMDFWKLMSNSCLRIFIFVHFPWSIMKLQSSHGNYCAVIVVSQQTFTFFFHQIHLYFSAPQGCVSVCVSMCVS